MNSSNHQYNYDINGIVKISCNCNNYFPSYFLMEPELTNPDLIIKVFKGNTKLPAEFTQISSDLFFIKKELQVISEINLFGVKASISVKHLMSNPTEVILSNRYQLLSKTLLKMPMSTVFPDSAFTQMLVHLKLLQKNYTFMIGSCFQPENKESAIIISSVGGMGKTSTVFKVLKEFGGKFLADDMVIINKDGVIYPYPKPVRLRKTNSTLSIESYKAPELILGSKDKIAKSSQVQTIIILERGSENKLTPISNQDMAQKLLIVTRKLLPYYMERTLLAYSYMDPSYDPFKLMQVESAIISKFAEHANCYVLTSKVGNPNATIETLKALI